MTDKKAFDVSALRGKRLALIGGKTIRKEVVASARKYGVKLINFGATKAALKPFLFNAMNKYMPNATGLLMKAYRIDAVLLIAAEKVIHRNLKWLCRSSYHYYSTEEQWNLLMNKQHFEEKAAQFGITPIPRYPVDGKKQTVPDAVKYPVVVKPAEGSGSAGISICFNEAEVKKALELALRSGDGDGVMCQKFLNGPYFQFEVWMQDGKAYFPYVKERVFYPAAKKCPPQPFVDFYPSAHQELISGLFPKIDKLMKELNVQNGSCMFQGIIDDGIPYIMDVGFRISGGLDFKVVQRETNVDLIDAHVLYALGGPFGQDFSRLQQPYRNAYAVVCIGLKNGVISRIVGLKDIKEKSYVFDTFQHYDVGYPMKSSGRFAQACFRFFLADENREKLKEDVKELLSLLRIENEKGESMILDYPQI